VSHKVTLVSWQSNRKTLDFRLLEEALHREDPTLEVEILCRKMERTLSGMLQYIPQVLRQMKAFATSEMVVADSYCIPLSVLNHRDGLKIMQIWHALSAIKMFGWQTVGKETGMSRTIAEGMYMHRNYDFVACASDVTAGYFCQAFGCRKENVVKLGLPRIDYILREDSETVTKIREKYPFLENGRKNIYYVPTLRKITGVRLTELVDALDPGKYNLIIRLHPLDRYREDLPQREGVSYINDFDTYSLMKACDIIISDYSSFVVEASLVDRPLYLYTYDREEYERDTGLNVRYEEEAIGVYQFDDAKELMQAMDAPYDFSLLQRFRDKFVDVEKEDCAGQMARFIVR
jgi:CDP-ribitol ribitolphosphotransferase